jgi:hypothetical protein
MRYFVSAALIATRAIPLSASRFVPADNPAAAFGGFGGEFLSLGTVCVIAIAFVWILLRSRTERQDPGGPQPLYDEACSVIVPKRFGFQLGSNFPISRAILYPDALMISGALNFAVPLQDILSVTLARRWFSQGVKINTRNDRAPELFLFLPRSRTFIGLIERQRLGSPVGDQ